MDQISILNDHLATTYRVEREVGQGGMATVYLAHDVRHVRRVALKVLRPELAVAVGKERFLREIRYAARLQHPHIVPVYDSGSAGPLLYYVMPFVEGESLAERLASGPLPVRDVLEMGRALADALQYAHGKGVVHRDIKPGNILLSGGHPSLTDFGVAKALSATPDESLTHTGIAVGTPAYMSPEQAAGGQEVDGRSDIYSLGCVLYESLSGMPPYGALTAQATIAQRFVEPPRRLRKLRADLPAAVELVVGRAMEKLPGNRFQSGGELSAAISAVLSGESPGFRRPRRGWALPVAATLAMLVLLAGFFWWRPRLQGNGVMPDAQVIAVLPFSASGPGVAVLGEGMVDLLSANLDGVGGIRAIDPRVVLHRWRDAAADGPVDTPRSLEVGREVNAGSVLLGSVVEGGPEVRMTAELLSAEGRRLARVQLDGPSDSLLAMVDELSVRLLREIWRSSEPIPSTRTAAITTGMPDAIRSYLAGEQHYRSSRWNDAIASFSRAVEIDSTFALAHIRLAHTYGWLEGHGSDRALEHLDAATRWAGRLPERERRLLAAHRMMEQGETAAIDSLAEYVADYPDDAEGWYELGDARYHARNLVALSTEDLFVAFERAAELLPAFVPFLIHPLELAVQSGDPVRFRQYLGQMEAGGDSSGAAGFRDLATAAWDSSAAGDSAMWRVARRQPSALGHLLGNFYEAGSVPAGRLLAGIDSAAANDATGAILALKARFLASRGRLREAAQVVDATYRVNPQSAVFASLYPVIAGFAQPTYAREGLDVLNAVGAANPLAIFWRGVFHAATGNTTGLRAQLMLGDSVGADTTALAGLFTALDGWANMLSGDSAGGIAAMRSGLDRVGFAPGVSSFSGPLTFELGMALSARPESAPEGIRLLSYGIDGQYEYRALGHLAAARALEAVGDPGGAVAAYDRFIRLWEDADPELQPVVEAARREVRRLVDETSS